MTGDRYRDTRRIPPPATEPPPPPPPPAGPRPPSPADLRCALDPTAVDALAAQLHLLACVPLAGPDPHTGDTTHTDADRGYARFLLLGLRDTGWTVHRREHPA